MHVGKCGMWVRHELSLLFPKEFSKKVPRRILSPFVHVLAHGQISIRAPVPDDLVCKHCKVNLLTTVNYVRF
jgi:hypothetical protein